MDNREFFDTYRTTFAAFDVEALAALFHFPLQVVSATADTVSVAAWSGEEMRGVLAGLFDAYRALGVVDGELVEFDTLEVSPGLASVRVHWDLRREDGSSVYDFTAIYTTVESEGTRQIAAISHDELPRLEAALAG